MHEAVLMLAKRRTGCLTAWKRFIVWNFGMKDPQNPNKIYRANIGEVAEYFKPAFIELGEQTKVKVKEDGKEKEIPLLLDHPDKAKNMPNKYPPQAFTPAGKVRNLRFYVENMVPARAYTEEKKKTTLLLFYMMKVANHNEGGDHGEIDKDTKGLAIPLAPGDVKWCYVFGDREEHNAKKVAEVAAHELTHAFWLDKKTAKKEKETISPYPFDDKGHDDKRSFVPGAAGDCLMNEGGGSGFCRWHLEALRRQRWGPRPGFKGDDWFFDRWREEKDRRKRR